MTLHPLRRRFIVGPYLQHLDQLRIVNDEDDLFLCSGIIPDSEGLLH